jgi:hypothetical protein
MVLLMTGDTQRHQPLGWDLPGCLAWQIPGVMHVEFPVGRLTLLARPVITPEDLQPAPLPPGITQEVLIGGLTGAARGFALAFALHVV